MEIVNFGFFERVQRSEAPSFIFFENEDGQDWYDIRPSLTSWDKVGSFVDAIYGVWATVRADGTIWNVETDPSRLVPDDSYVLGIDADRSQVQKEMRWDQETNTLLPALPAEPIVPEVISDRQFFQQLAEQGQISWDEAEEAVGPGILPASMQALIDQLPAGADGNDRNRARMALRGATTFERSHPLTETIRQLYDWTVDELDSFWLAASEIR